MFYERFVVRFPEVGYAETRTARIEGRRGLPDGNYGFMELFCTDPACDCRRAIIQVLEEKAPDKVVATINYGWETLQFYRSWYHDEKGAAELVGTSLEPLGKQGPNASSLLRLFEHLLTDQSYADRIPRHYEMFKRAQQTPSPQPRKPRGK
jgi:hypothetical protein